MPVKRQARTKLKISAPDALSLLARTNVAAEEGKLLDLEMPNGKLLRNCNRKDLLEIAEALEEAGLELDRLKNFFSAQLPP